MLKAVREQIMKGVQNGAGKGGFGKDAGGNGPKQDSKTPTTGGPPAMPSSPATPNADASQDKPTDTKPTDTKPTDTKPTDTKDASPDATKTADPAGKAPAS